MKVRVGYESRRQLFFARFIESYKRSVELCNYTGERHIRYDKKGAANSTEYGIAITSTNITREWGKETPPLPNLFAHEIR